MIAKTNSPAIRAAGREHSVFAAELQRLIDIISQRRGMGR